MAPSMFQLMTNDGRGWFLASVLVACLLEGVGFISLAIHQQSLTNHLAFFISFSTTLVAPFILNIINTACFARIASAWTTSESSTVIKYCCNALNTLQLVALTVLGFSIYDISVYLSPAPIMGPEAALHRLDHYERALALLSIAHFLALCGLAAFASFAAIWTIPEYSKRSSSEKTSIKAVNVITVLSLVRMMWKVCEYLLPATEDAQLIDMGNAFWLGDALPILIAFSILCTIIPGFSTPRATSIRRRCTLQFERHTTLSEKQPLLHEQDDEDLMV